MFLEGISEVHVSVTFTWDMEEAKRLASMWERIAPVKLGGPATGERGGQFTPGLYLKQGYVITSRGCPNNCWFCSVPKREGRQMRELKIANGWNVLDDNLLACSYEHTNLVFDMLARQSERVHLTGGLEARILEQWHCEMLADLKPKQVFFAYDTPDDYEPLVEASNKFKKSGWGTRNNLRVYVLIGHPKDTFDKAEARLRQVMDLGMSPMAMLYRDDRGLVSPEWRQFQRSWARPAIVFSRDKAERRKSMFE